MDSQIPSRTFKDSVIGTIKKHGLEMKPRWHFVLKTCLIICGAALAVTALLFLASFIVFTLRASGAWFAPWFGPRGWMDLLRSLPWILLLLSGAFLIILEILVRNFSFAYRQPLLYSAVAIALLAALGGAAMERTRMHHELFLRARQGTLPFGGQMYREYGMRDRGVRHGSVIGLTPGGFRMRDLAGAEIDVRISDETRFPFGTGFRDGDDVVVFGDRHGDVVSADGIRKVDPEFFDGNVPPPGRRGRPIFRCQPDPTPVENVISR